MSSLVRRIQKGAKAASPYYGRGSKLGSHNNGAKDLAARIKREERVK